MNRRTIPALLILAAAGWGACESSNIAAAAGNCGGQAAAPQPVPYQCLLPVKVIDGTGFSAVVTANGTTVTVTINLAAPRQVDTPARIVHHEGISGAGGLSDQAQGIIPAGALSITLTDSAPCRAGQLDVKVWHVGNGQPEGRVGGPWIENGNSCIDLGSTVPTTSPPVATTAPATTVPGTPTTHAAPPASSSTVPGTTPTLPATGIEGRTMFLWAVGIFAFGFALKFWAWCIGAGWRDRT